MNARNLDDFTMSAFESASLDASAFDHEAHIYVAWLYLQRYETSEAISRFANALQRLTTRLGVAGKYHETVTWFYMLLIAERRIAEETWSEFRIRNHDLFDPDNDVLSRYYKADTLASERARRSFVLPDSLAA